MSKFKSTPLIILFFALISWSSWYFLGFVKNTKVSFTKEIQSLTNATITNLSVKEFDDNGKLINFLESPLICRMPKKNSHYLTSPHIIISEDNKSPWEITSGNAIALNGGKEVIFNQDVVILQKKQLDTDSISLYTEQISYFPESKVAMTKKNIKLQQANNVILSTGMKAFLAENRVQLLSNAHGHYEQNNG